MSGDGMGGVTLSVVVCLFLACISTEATMDATTFNHVAYNRGVPHRRGLSSRMCDKLCQRRSACWGTNYIEGINGQRGECQLLYDGVATCDPSSHRRMPTRLRAHASWVRGTCPLQRKVFGGLNSLFRHPNAKSLTGGEKCKGGIVQWSVVDNANVPNGAYIRGPETFLECLDRCAMHSGCSAVDFNFDFRACFHFGTSEMLEKDYVVRTDDCCAHAKIQCDGVPTTSAPTAAPIISSPPAITTGRVYPRPGGYTGAPPQSRYTVRPGPRETPSTSIPTGVTERPKVITSRLIPDQGCPAPFIKFPLSGRQGGTPVLSLPQNSSEACKQHCLDLGDDCAAVDYDNDVEVCYTFSTPDPQNLARGTRSCCDHYTRLHCNELTARSCYQHGPLLFLANPNEHNIIVSAMPPRAPPDLVIVSCAGVCYQNLNHDKDFGFFSLERGCNTSAGSGRSWRSCQTSGDPFNFDKNCSCAFDRCNAVNTFLFDHLTCHYSFDRNSDDLSGFNRDGRSYNITYDPVTAVRGYSAQLDGVSSYIHYPGWHLVHAENIGPDGTPLLSFTVAMWILRPATSRGGSMTVLSTYGRDLSTIQILSELDADNPWVPEQTIKAAIVVNHTMYEIMAPAPLDEWFFIVFTLDGLRSPPLLALDVNDLENIEPEASMELTGVGALDELTITNRGLFLGKQAQIIEGIDEPYFFEGHIDDVFAYDRTLSYHEMLALRDMHLDLP